MYDFAADFLRILNTDHDRIPILARGHGYGCGAWEFTYACFADLIPITCEVVS